MEAVQKQESSSVYNQFAMQLPFLKEGVKNAQTFPYFYSFSVHLFFFSSFLVFVKREIHQPNNCENTTQMQLIHFLLEFAESLKHQVCMICSFHFKASQFRLEL